jgi:hypothetical protein
MIFLQREERRGVRDSGGSGAVDSVGGESGGGDPGGGESVGGGESGAVDSVGGESGAGEPGAGEPGAGESGAGESGAGESRSGESGAGERFSFSCPSCPFQSSTRDGLRNHVLTHLLGTLATCIPSIFLIEMEKNLRQRIFTILLKVSFWQEAGVFSRKSS